MSIAKGQILKGTVTGITNFGAFVKLETGDTGLVHISEVADSFVKDVNDFLKVDDVVKVFVVSTDDKGKISLSIKRAKEKKKPQRPSLSFEDKISRFMKDSDEKLASLNKNMNAKRRSGNRY
ncbi:S1 RNA-binding domain-containing protein [Peptococcus simiae]|uniref:S1 RNA-binding domain-containing protein n=1 Tax=Peptococcus simiae TaxID=1643805 RepID=A0ABW9GY64_9FIRM